MRRHSLTEYFSQVVYLASFENKKPKKYNTAVKGRQWIGRTTRAILHLMEITREDYAALPKQPGVYFMKDGAGNVLYIGKAKNLRSRVSSYFQKRAGLEPAKRLMVQKVKRIEVIFVKTEQEALLLEATLIRRHKPAFNVVMRDETSFLYLTINEAEDFPTLEVIRRLPKPGAGRSASGGKRLMIFGPYSSAQAVRRTQKLLKGILGFRTCTPKQGKPCFDYHLGRCRGVCIGKITPEQYRKQVVEPMKQFLSGKLSWIEEKLEQDMRNASREKQFERAAKLRDHLRAVRRLTERQAVISQTHIDADALALARDQQWTLLHLFQIREGKIVDQKPFLLKNPAETPSAEIFSAFLELYYAGTAEKPKRVLLPVLPQNARSLEEELGMRLAAPRRGTMASLLKQGALNAEKELERRKASWASDKEKARKALEEISKALRLAEHPKRIEAYDISNVQGKHAVGAMVVFENGMPKKEAYRKFIIRTVHKPDDPRMMAEMLRRRLMRLRGKHTNAPWPKPNLILLDGGKTQLALVRPVIEELAPDIPYVALAKKEEELFRPGRQSAIKLPRDSEGLYLLQRLRDEAHRFAISLYRGKHRKAQEQSVLDSIPGIGPTLKKQLLLAFGSVAGIRKASFAERARVVGNAKAELLAKHL